jgi:hypothetical protein
MRTEPYGSLSALDTRRVDYPMPAWQAAHSSRLPASYPDVGWLPEVRWGCRSGVSDGSRRRMSSKFEYERLRPTGRCVLNMVHFLHE